MQPAGVEEVLEGSLSEKVCVGEGRMENPSRQPESIAQPVGHLFADREPAAVRNRRERFEVELADPVALRPAPRGAVRPGIEHVVEDSNGVQQVDDVAGMTDVEARSLGGDDDVEAVEVESPGGFVAGEDALGGGFVERKRNPLEDVTRLRQRPLEPVGEDLRSPATRRLIDDDESDLHRLSREPRELFVSAAFPHPRSPARK